MKEKENEMWEQYHSEEICFDNGENFRITFTRYTDDDGNWDNWCIDCNEEKDDWNKDFLRFDDIERIHKLFKKVERENK